jgi:hypothetical protein
LRKRSSGAPVGSCWSLSCSSLPLLSSAAVVVQSTAPTAHTSAPDTGNLQELSQMVLKVIVVPSLPHSVNFSVLIASNFRCLRSLRHCRLVFSRPGARRSRCFGNSQPTENHARCRQGHYLAGRFDIHHFLGSDWDSSATRGCSALPGLVPVLSSSFWVLLGSRV